MNSSGLMEISMEVLQDIASRSSTEPGHSAPSHHAHPSLHTEVYRHTIHTIKVIEGTLVPNNRAMDKDNVVYRQ